jgi:hypothetical protein
MRNITVSVNDESYRTARVWAAERDVSLSAIVAYLIEHLPERNDAARQFPVPPASAQPANSAASNATLNPLRPPNHEPLTRDHGQLINDHLISDHCPTPLPPCRGQKTRL